MLSDAVLSIAVLLVSVVIHENAHGVTALALGDDTARKTGRLTLNPIKHLDLVGSLILPALMFFTTRSMFGYAKPVPINPSKLQGRDRWGFAVVALAGPVSNVILAVIALTVLQRTSAQPAGLVSRALVAAVELNLLLAAFNLVPIPPLDGSRLLRIFLTANGRQTLDRIEPYGFLILFAIIVWLSEPFFRVVDLIRSGLLRILPL
jgi:Zn-dependent protease